MCMCTRIEGISVAHLELWIEDLRVKIIATDGFAMFQLVKQKLALELELKQLRKELK